MQRSVTYTILIARRRGGYVAQCPAMPTLSSRATSRREAYRALKDLIRSRLLDILTSQQLVPTDPVVSLKSLRLNLVELQEEVDLR